MVRGSLKVKLAVSSLLISGFIAAPTAKAEDKFEDLIARATEYKNQGKIPQALGELSWAQKQLEDLHSKKIESFLKPDINGFTAAEPQTENTPFGTVVSRNYTATGSKTVIKASLTGPATSDGSGSAGMGLGGLTQMAMAMGGAAPGTETIRVSGQRAMLMKEGRDQKLMVNLPGNQVLTVEGESGSPTKEQLVAVAEGVDLTGLQTYIGK